EELVCAMGLLAPEEYFLLIVGSGDVFGSLRRMAADRGLEDRIRFIDRLPFGQLSALTRKCQLGITLDKGTNLNYRFSLPNKLFDYIHAGIPVLASNLPEVSGIIEGYQVGTCVSEVTPEAIAAGIRFMFGDPERYLGWKSNTAVAARELCWEQESKVLSGTLSLMEPGPGLGRKINSEKP
ncbi:MAG TPA: glycosyltransferase, partial [Chitinophagaceae bacterium]|nr:glycosyltransferase [Chitinophagaceae bacterium]